VSLAGIVVKIPIRFDWVVETRGLRGIEATAKIDGLAKRHDDIAAPDKASPNQFPVRINTSHKLADSVDSLLPGD
jgi:hypothetical protein